MNSSSYKLRADITGKPVEAQQFLRGRLQECEAFAGNNFVNIGGSAGSGLSMSVKNSFLKKLEKGDDGVWNNINDEVYQENSIYEYCWMVKNDNGSLILMTPNDFWKKYRHPIGEI